MSSRQGSQGTGDCHPTRLGVWSGGRCIVRERRGRPGSTRRWHKRFVLLPGYLPARLGRVGKNISPTPIPHHPPNNPTLAPPQPLALLPRYQPRAGASVSPHSQVLGTRVWGGAASGLQKRRLRRYAPRRRSQACERWCVTSQIQECN